MELSSAKVRVEIVDALPVPEIGRLPVSGTVGSALDVFDDHRRSFASRSENFTHLSYSFEGDLGSWAIVERRDGSDFLLLHGDWSWHRDWFHAGNQLCDERASEIMGRHRLARRA